MISGEHPDWDEYRQAMVDQGKPLLRITISNQGPIATGGFPLELADEWHRTSPAGTGDRQRSSQESSTKAWRNRSRSVSRSGEVTHCSTPSTAS